MNQNYHDILSRISEEPRWFDEHAVPRFCEFHPGEVADIYAEEVVLAEITCQECGQQFLVALSYGVGRWLDERDSPTYDHRRLAALIKTKALHYGDPPNISCCAAGATMNSEPHRVIEYWCRNHREFTKTQGEANIVTNVSEYFRWKRDSSLEIDIRPAWVKNPDA
ncbi:MAG: hypothetical protein JO267_14305 [Alphaproteobacteria bacterium]|nr:hypothetical protein [Alphaproteobacteria bacterium]